MAQVSKRDKIRPFAVKNSRVGVSIDGGDFQHIFGASVIGHTAGTASVEQVQTFDAVGAISGSATVESVTLDLAALQPQFKGMNDLQRAYQAGDPVSVRWDMYSKQLLAAVTPVTAGSVAIAVETSGNVNKGSVATFAGSNARFSEAAVKSAIRRGTLMVGDLITVGGTPFPTGETDPVAATAVYVVHRVEHSDRTGAIGDVYLKEWSAGAPVSISTIVAATPYRWQTAGARYEFSGTVTQLGSFGGDTAGDPAVSSGVQFQPANEIALPDIIAYNEAGSGW